MHECDSDREGEAADGICELPPEAGGLAGHLGAAVVVRHLVVVEQGVAAPAENYTYLLYHRNTVRNRQMTTQLQWKFSSTEGV